MTQITIKTQGAEIVRQGLQDLGAEVPKIGRLGIYRGMQSIVRRMKTPGSPPTYPINWDSEKQKRFVLAMLRSRDDLPYTRNGRYIAEWGIVKSGEIGYMIHNEAPQAVYIGGNYEGMRQSRIHEGRWPVFHDEVEAELEKMPTEIESHITYYARSKGF